VLLAKVHSGDPDLSVSRQLTQLFAMADVYLTSVLTRIVNGHPNSEIDHLLPWAYRRQDLKAMT
jgi:hypothetical protein